MHEQSRRRLHLSVERELDVRCSSNEASLLGHTSPLSPMLRAQHLHQGDRGSESPWPLLFSVCVCGVSCVQCGVLCECG